MWIVLLTIYVIRRAANNVPNMVANEEHGENEVPVQDAVPNVVANEEHGENEVPVQDAVPNVVAHEEKGYKMSVEEIGHSSGSDELVINNNKFNNKLSYPCGNTTFSGKPEQQELTYYMTNTQKPFQAESPDIYHI